MKLPDSEIELSCHYCTNNVVLYVDYDKQIGYHLTPDECREGIESDGWAVRENGSETVLVCDECLGEEDEDEEEESEGFDFLSLDDDDGEY